MKAIWGALALLCIGTAALADPAPVAAPAQAAQDQPGKGFGGLSYDSNKPIQVNANTFFADLNADTGTYQGNVVVVQGDMKLHADVVKVYAPNGKARRMEAHGHVVVDSPSGTATGDDGTYDVVTRVIHLTGNVVLTKDRNVMHGNALDVAMATGQAHLVATDQQGRPARVQAVFIPNQQGTGAESKPPKPPRAQQGASQQPSPPAASPAPAAQPGTTP
jgi:lipopolysaccharide export system protein LptA